MKIDDVSINTFIESEIEGIEINMISGKEIEQVRILYQPDLGFITIKSVMDKFPWLKQIMMGKTFSTINEFDQLLFTLDATSHKTNLGKNLVLGLSIVFAKLMAKTGGINFRDFISKLAKGDINKSLNYLIQLGREDEIKGSDVFWKVFLTNNNNFNLAYKNWQIINDHLNMEIKEGRIKNVFSEQIEEILKVLQEIKLKYRIDHGYYISSKGMEVNNGLYSLGSTQVTVAELTLLYQKMMKDYEILGLEDPFVIQDEEAIFSLKEKKDTVVGNKILEGMSLQSIKALAEKRVISGAVISLVDIGSMSEIIQLVLIMKKNNWKIYISENDSKVLDNSLFAIAEGLGVKGIKMMINKRTVDLFNQQD